ncbi:MAG: hypothetical protein LUO89_01965 [Methanothrix sp.]|nr:hypothetical protein [Methanothrix sp.]
MIHDKIISLKHFLIYYIGIVLVVFLPAGIEKRSEAQERGTDGTTDALVRKIVHGYGGATVLENTHSLSARGLIESPLYEGPAEYSFFLKRDRKLRVETRSGRSFEVRILNGRNGNYQAAGSPMTEASGSRLLSMIYQFKELTMPYQLMTAAFTITAGGPSSVNGKPAIVLMLKDKEGPPMKLYVDRKSYRIVKDSGVFSMDGAETELSSEFHDFKKVDGRLLPFRVVNYAGGQKIGELHIREYRVNPELPDSLFMPEH